MTKRLEHGIILLPSHGSDVHGQVDQFIKNKNKMLHPNDTEPLDTFSTQTQSFRRLMENSQLNKQYILGEQSISRVPRGATVIHEPTTLEVAMYSHDPFAKRMPWK